MFNPLKWWVVIVLTGILIIYLIPQNLSVCINEKLNRNEVERIAGNYLYDNGYDTDNYHISVTGNQANYITSYLNSKVEREKFDRLVNSDLIPNIRWQANFVRNIPKDQPQTNYLVWVSPRGNVLGFKRSLPDTLTIESMTEDEATRLAQIFLTDRIDAPLNNYILRKSQQFKLANRTDFTFIWEKDAEFAPGKYVIQVYVQGNEIGGYDYLFYLPESEQQKLSEETTKGTFLFLVQFIGLAMIFLFALILFLKKYHEGEISVNLGRNLFLIVFIIGLLRSINEFPVAGNTVSIGNMSAFNVQLIMFIYEVLLKNVFIGILILTSWTVGEAYARSHWPEKMNSIDSILNNRFFTLQTGTALLRGGAIGFTTALIYLGISDVLTGFGKEIVQIAVPFSGAFQYFVPVVSMVIISVMVGLISEVIFRFFIINVVYVRWPKKWLAIIVSAILWPIGYNIFSDYLLFSSIPINFLLAFIMGVIFAWLYFKYDLLTLIAATASANLILYAMPLWATDNSWHKISLYFLLFLLIVPVLQIIISSIKREEFQYSYEGLPNHIRRISERERMQKELEIARNVQMGLLPKTKPVIEGFDISGKCLPAKEVGGDYYDFVTLSPTKLGIAIGDVSGKGVPAAIYMTLTKGILQSHADETVSPRLVLNKVNKLLYRNIEKNSFVSMFYAVLDTEKKELTFARAGHNPGIMINQQDGSNQELNTDGIALGLEEGAVFNRTLKEHTIQLKAGDTLVFYTDGFTEAMNRQKEEFGEERLVRLISKHRHIYSQDLIEVLVKNIKGFTKEIPQHDDMTIVVIKLTG